MPRGLQPCSSSPIKVREASADRVVLPVPDSPKKIAQSPFGPTLAEQCIGNTSRVGSTKLRYPNTDFLISPAYRVPPIKTKPAAKLTRMKVSERMPSSS